MPRREPKPDDYETNLDYSYDIGCDVDLEERRYYDCSLCASGRHDDCQEAAIALCKCFLNDHMETF
jgi:hypothetical protein